MPLPIATPTMPPILCAKGVPPPLLVPRVPVEVATTVVVEPETVAITVERNTDVLACRKVDEEADASVRETVMVGREELG
jgi:hypothetical protein